MGIITAVRWTFQNYTLNQIAQTQFKRLTKHIIQSQQHNIINLMQFLSQRHSKINLNILTVNNNKKNIRVITKYLEWRKYAKNDKIGRKLVRKHDKTM